MTIDEMVAKFPEEFQEHAQETERLSFELLRELRAAERYLHNTEERYYEGDKEVSWQDVLVADERAERALLAYRDATIIQAE